jgi:PAS domain S-box-containing protein
MDRVRMRARQGAGSVTRGHFSNRSTLEFFPLVIAMAIAAAIAVFSVRDWTTYARSSTEAHRHDQIIELANALLSDLKDAETGQRGYLLTGKEEYLEPYRISANSINADLSALAALYTTSEQTQVDRTRALVQEKLLELRETINLRRTGGITAALSVVETDRGKRLMDEIRHEIRSLLQEQESSRERARDALENSATFLRWLSVLGSLTLVGLLLAAQIALARANAKRFRLINDLQTSRDEISAAKELLETTLQSIGDGVIITDAEGRVTFLNPLAQHLTGWTQQSAVGVPLHRVFRILNEATRESVENPVEKVIRTGRIAGLANHTILVTLDGWEIPIDDSAAPIRNAKDTVVGTVLVFRDITERRRAEIELQKGRSELEQSNSTLRQLNADLELFSYAAGHDLQEPLRTIVSFSDLVARKLQGNTDVVQQLRFIQRAVKRMQAMINGLLHYSQLMRVGTLDIAEVSMDEILGEALLNCESAIAENHAVIHTGSLPTIRANRQQMVQLVQNLISNAIKYRTEKLPEIHITSDTSNGGDWLFTVRDNGIGVDMSYAETIFQVFRRLHSADQYPGTGLGLAMCKRIVELHGGRIWIESEPGCGSIFRFSISQDMSNISGALSPPALF